MNRIGNLAALNAAKGNPDRWTRNGEEWTMKLDALTLIATRTSEKTLYRLEDGDGQVVRSGSADTAELARADAIFYAIAYVKVSADDRATV